MPAELTVVPNVPIAEVGTWRTEEGDGTFTTEDFEAAVAAVRSDPAIRLPRLWIAHDRERLAEGPSSTRGMSVGWGSNLRTDGRMLFADLHVPPLLADTLHAHFPGRSIEAWRGVVTATGMEHRFIVPGIALLGAELPAVETLPDIAELWGIAPDREAVPAGDPPQIVAASRLIVCALGRDTPAPAGPVNPEQEGPVPDPVTEPEATEPTAPEAEAAAPEPTTPTPTPDPASPAAEAPTAVEPTIPDGMTVVDAEAFSSLRDEVAGLRAWREQREAADRDAAREELLAGAIAAGRIPPARRVHYAALYDADPEGTTSLVNALEPGVIPVAGERVAASRPGNDNHHHDVGDGFSARLLSGAERARLEARGVKFEED